MANEGTKPAKAAYAVAVRFTLRPGTTQKAREHFERVSQQHRRDKEGWHYWTFYSQLGPGDTYVVVAPGASLAAFDRVPAGGLLGRSADEADSLLTDLESTFQSHDRALLEYLPDYSNHPQKEGEAPGPLLFHTRFTLKPGTTKAMKDGVSKLLQHHVTAKDSGKQFWTFGTVAGGDERTYHVLMPFDSYGGLKTAADNTLLTKIQEGFLTDLDSNILSIERTVLEYLPKFSNPPSA